MEQNYNLIQRLKEINAVLRDTDRSVIEHYAGISELALFPDYRKIGVLTVGLFNDNPQVRKLAADVLKQTYGLGNSSTAVLQLLENDAEGLQEAIYHQDQDKFKELLSKVEPLLRQRHTEEVDGDIVDYARQHVLIILGELGRKLREIQDAEAETETHFLKLLLQDTDNRWILDLILECLLSSEDVYCRRRAILVVGQLGLEFDGYPSPFDLILEVIDRPENCDNYLVTRDGIEALTVLAKQNPNKLLQPLYKKLRKFYNQRSYNPLKEPGKGEEHRFYTRQDCVEALGAFFCYEQLKVLITDGERGNFLHMMDYDRNPDVKVTSPIKRLFINSFLQIYQQDGNNQLTPRQREILDKISTWIGSKDIYVSSAAICVFGNLPNLRQGLDYLLQNARKNNISVKELLSKWQAENISRAESKKIQEELSNFLSEREELITALNTVVAKAADNDAELLKEKGKEFSQILQDYCYQKNVISNQKESTLNKLNEQLTRVRLLALWTLYNSSANMTDIPSLDAEIISNLLSEEENESLRSVLELFRARNSGEQFWEQLHLIATGKDDELVRVCAKIELLIQAHKCNELLEQEDLSDTEVKCIQIRIGQLKGIHPSLALRFLPVLAQLNKPNATKLVKYLLLNENLLRGELRIQLIESLSGYHCYELREDILKMLLQRLKERHKQTEYLRLDYTNLLRAGEYKKLETRSGDLQLPEWEELSEKPDRDLKKQVLEGLQKITDDFKMRSLPLLFNNPRVVELDSLSPRSVNDVLYASERKDTEDSTINVYLRSQPFPKSLIFLEQAISDTEIARSIRALIQAAPEKPSSNQLRFTNVKKSIVGRVEKVTDNGAFVNVGLLRLKPFVSFEAMYSTDIPNNASDLAGVLLEFQILSVTFNISNDSDLVEIVELKLSRKFPHTDLQKVELAKTLKGETLQAYILDVRDGDESCVVFRIQEYNEYQPARLSDLRVPLSELSWRSDSNWVLNAWPSNFAQKIGQPFEITYKENEWSLRVNEPKITYFLQLLFDKGTEEFELVYANKQSDKGYVFEIEPGKNCYVPAERLVKLNEKGSLSFLLPSKKIKSGDILKVKFDFQYDLKGNKEVILNVLEVKETEWAEGRLFRGKRIDGKLVEIDQNDKSQGKVRLSSREYPQMSGLLVSITNLPIDDSAIKVDELVSGVIKSINLSRKTFTLEYDAVAIPSKLVPGQSYLCQIDAHPQPGDYRLRLRYGNVSGELRECDMTYGHTSVLFDEKGQRKYAKGDRLMVRLAKPIKWEQICDTIVTLKPERILPNLGFDKQKLIEGDVVSITPEGKITFEKSNRQRVEISLLDFESQNNHKPQINLGDRIELSQPKPKQMRIRVLHPARVSFTLLPNLDNPEELPKWNEILTPGKEYKCFYVDCTNEYYLLESEPGEVFALPLSCIGKTTQWLSNDDGQRWRLTHKETVEVVQQEDSESQNEVHQSYEVYTGDVLTLIRSATDSTVQLRQFEPSPLHWEANESIRIVGKVNRRVYQSNEGIKLELDRVLSGNGLPLRSGIISLYRWEQMNREHKQRFKNDNFNHGDPVEVILAQPPQINTQGELLLKLRSDKFCENTLLTLEDKLREIIQEIKENLNISFKGEIKRYDKSRRAFLVTLDKLCDYQECKCWLPEDEVSYSLVQKYEYVKAFGSKKEDLCRSFTVLQVDIDGKELKLSLKSNPSWDIDELCKELELSNVTHFKRATFIEELCAKNNPHILEKKLLHQSDNSIEETKLEVVNHPKKIVVVETELPNIETEFLPVDEISEKEAEESSADPALMISVELVPGALINIAAERFFIQGEEYLKINKKLRPQSGDQITLEIFEENNFYNINVIKTLPSQISRLADKKRVWYGEMGTVEDGKVKIRIPGYESYHCFLAAEFQDNLDKAENYKLFRCMQRINQELYFEPVAPQDLKRDDVLLVNYQETQESGIIITFGNKCRGYIHKTSISYRSDFELSEIRPEFIKDLAARVVDASTSRVEFTLKGAANRRLDYFLDSRVQERLKNGFNSVLVRQETEKNYIDIEIDQEPGAVIRVPYDSIQDDSKAYTTNLQLDKLKPGDQLKFKFNIQKQQQVNLQLVGVVKSFLHYLEHGMYVQVQYLDRHKSGWWQFLLPEYAPIKGITNEELPRPYDKDLRLVVDRIEKTASDKVYLCQGTMNDRQLMLRVENISSASITVKLEDGKTKCFLRHFDATYRVNNRSQYLQENLKEGDVIVATKDNNGNLSLRENKAVPFIVLRQYLNKNNIKLTYVGSQSDDQIFEIKPGQLVAIPTAKLYFYDTPLRDWQRFCKGDIFTVKISRVSASEPDKFNVVVIGIKLSVLHNLQDEQFIQAKVLETVEGRGITIKAEHLELEQFIPNKQLMRKSPNNFREGDEIWLQVKKPYPNPLTYYELCEVERPSLQVLQPDSGPKSLFVYAQISRRFGNKVELDVLGEAKIDVWLNYIAWFDVTSSNTVDEVLLPQEQGMWVAVFNDKGKLCANPKALRSYKVNQQLETEQKIQAQVLQINEDEDGNTKSVLLDMDGVRTLVPSADLVWGVPNKCKSVEPGTWLNVVVSKAQYNQYKSEEQRFSVNPRDVNKDLMNAPNSFKAIVRYTLPHGLVFSYRGALGYVPNEQLAWSDNVRATEMFTPWEEIDIYKVDASKFSLKHESQNQKNWQGGEQIEANAYRKTDNGVYVIAQGIRAFVSRAQLGSERLAALSEQDKILLQVEYIDKQNLQVEFRPVRQGGDRHNQSLATNDDIRQTLETYYMTSVNNFKDKFQDKTIINLLVQEKLDLADKYSKQGNHQEALNTYSEAVQINPKHSLAWYKKGEILRSPRGRYKEAIDSYDSAINHNREWGSASLADAYYSRGLARLQLKNYEAAIKDFDQTILQNSDLSDAYHSRGMVRFQLKDYQAAIADFNQLLEKQPDHTKAYYSRGTAHLQLGNYQAALADLDQAIQQNIDYASAYYSRGMAHLQLGNFEAAILDLERALGKNPNYAEAYYSRGLAHCQLNHNQAAISDFNQALQLKPDYAEVYLSRGKLSYKIGEHQQAISDFNETLRLKPEYFDAYYNMGTICYQSGEYQRAIFNFDKVIELKPDYVDAYYSRGVAHLQLGKPQAAILDFEQVLGKNPNYADAYYSVAEVRSQLGDKQTAKEDFLKAAEIFLHHRKIDDCLKALNKFKELGD